MAGKHVDAISRMNDLTTDSADTLVDPAVYVVQARETCPFSGSVITDVFHRHICTFSLGTSRWKTATTSVRFSRLKTPDVNWVTGFVNHRL